jgi:hypothetical protein
VPVIFAIVATGTSNIYRRDILNDRKKHSKHHSEGPIVIGLDNGWN